MNLALKLIEAAVAILAAMSDFSIWAAVLGLMLFWACCSRSLWEAVAWFRCDDPLGFDDERE